MEVTVGESEEEVRVAPEWYTSIVTKEGRTFTLEIVCEGRELTQAQIRAGLLNSVGWTNYIGIVHEGDPRKDFRTRSRIAGTVKIPKNAIEVFDKDQEGGRAKTVKKLTEITSAADLGETARLVTPAPEHAGIYEARLARSFIAKVAIAIRKTHPALPKRVPFHKVREPVPMKRYVGEGVVKKLHMDRHMALWPILGLPKFFPVALSFAVPYLSYLFSPILTGVTLMASVAANYGMHLWSITAGITYLAPEFRSVAIMAGIAAYMGMKLLFFGLTHPGIGVRDSMYVEERSVPLGTFIGPIARAKANINGWLKDSMLNYRHMFATKTESLHLAAWRNRWRQHHPSYLLNPLVELKRIVWDLPLSFTWDVWILFDFWKIIPMNLLRLVSAGNTAPRRVARILPAEKGGDDDAV